MFLAQHPPAMGERRLSLHAGLRTFLHAERATYPVEQASICTYAQFSKIKRAPSLFFPINMKQGMPATTNFSHRVVYQILFAHRPLFFRKIVEIKRFALRAGTGAFWEEARKTEGL